MNRCKFALTMGAGLVFGLAGMVNADDAADLRAEVAALRQEVATLKGSQDTGLLDQRRAEEIKGLIQEVLSDADTRASLMAEGAVAGHDGVNFFLSSVDGTQRLNFWGQIQFRYLFNLELEDEDDQEDEGFQTRRAKLGFNGHVTAGRKWEYEIILALDRGDEKGASGSTFFEDVKFGTQITDAIRVDAGKFKLPFLREELISSKRMLTVERSAVNENFTLNRAEQVQLSFKSDMIKIAVALSDGSNSEYSDIGTDMVEFAITGRLDVKLSGDWNQAADTSAWSGQPFAFFVGAAAHYESGDGPNGGLSDYFAWTIDASIETGGLGIFGAIVGATIDPDTGGTVDPWAFVIQVSYNINDTVEPFGRFEWLDDDTNDDEAMLVTAGFNYYVSKNHNAKFTLDVVWVLQADEDGFVTNSFGASSSGGAVGTGLGASVSDGVVEDTVIIRAQFQLLF
jgi:hypothetical protein